MLYAALALAVAGAIGVFLLFKQVRTLRETVSRLQRNAIDVDYNLKTGWESNSEKLKRLARRLSENAPFPIHTVTYSNVNRKLYVTSPMMNLLTLAREDNIPVSSGCYGEGTCGQCSFVPLAGAEHLSPRTEKEVQTIQMFNYPESARLSCQCRVSGDVTVELLNPLESGPPTT